MASIQITEGPARGQQLEVESDLILGRENADLTIEDLELSRHHARLRPGDGFLEVEDLGSLNGTWVNGMRIPTPTRLNPGDVVKVGLTVIEVLEDPYAQKQGDDTVAQRTVMQTAESAQRAQASPGREPVRPVGPVERVRPAERVGAAPAEAAAVTPTPAGGAGRRNLEWLAAAGVIPFTLLTLIAIVLPASSTPRPGSKADKFLEFFVENDAKILIAFGLITVAVFFFFPYLGLLWRTFRQVEGEPAWLSAIVFASGISMATISVAGNAFWGAAAHRADEGLNPQVARALFDLGSIFYMPWLPLAVYMAAAAVLIFRTGVFPRWLGKVAAFSSPLILISGYPGGPLVLQIIAHLGLLAWVFFTVATGLMLMRRYSGRTAQP